MFRNSSKYISSQCSKLSPYFSPIHNGLLIIMFSNLNGTGRFLWKIRAWLCVITSVCKHKEVVLATRLSHVSILQVVDHLKPFLTAAGIIKCIILMTDCNPERNLCLWNKWMKLNYIPVLNVLLITESLNTQDFYFKENLVWREHNLLLG